MESVYMETYKKEYARAYRAARRNGSSPDMARFLAESAADKEARRVSGSDHPMLRAIVLG
jgi:hypothetical protein